MEENATVRLRQVNLVVGAMGEAVGFYRLLGVDLPDPYEWPLGSGAEHVQPEPHRDGGASIELDNPEMAALYAPGLSPGAVIIGFELASSEAVDETYSRLAAAGHRWLLPPFDAFWGARYAIVEDPQGNRVGLMGPVDPDRRYVPGEDRPGSGVEEPEQG